jgi:hypothetical protein
MELFDTILELNISQLIRKYDDELVFKLWEERKTAGGHDAYFGVFGWKLRCF